MPGEVVEADTSKVAAAAGSLRSGERLVVRGAMAANALPLERTSPGAKVYLSWEPDRGLVYPVNRASSPPTENV